jgi:hypothetical protein
MLKPNTWTLAIVALVLTAAAAFLGIYIDNHYGQWFSTHPITANLSAGILGLPAAFLIVNLAAERALRWGEMSKWRPIRLGEATDLFDAWQHVRFSFTHRYSIERERSYRKIKSALSDLSSITDVDKLEDFDVELMKKHCQVIEEARRFFQLSDADNAFRQKSVMHLLPRLESARADPHTVSIVRAATDSMVELGNAINNLDVHWADFEVLGEWLKDRKLFTPSKREEAVRQTRAYASAHRRLIDGSLAAYVDMETLANHLKDRMDLTEWWNRPLEELLGMELTEQKDQ